MHIPLKIVVFLKNLGIFLCVWYSLGIMLDSVLEVYDDANIFFGSIALSILTVYIWRRINNKFSKE